MSSQPSGIQADSKSASSALSAGSGAANGRTHWLVVAALGLVGGLLAGLLLDQTYNFFPIIEPKEVKNVQILTTEQRALVDKAHLVADNKNIPLSIGVMGAAVAGAVGLGLALLRPAPGRPTVAGLMAGLLAGGGLGALGGLAAVQVRQALIGWNTLNEFGAPDPLRTQLHAMAIHLPSWIAIALAVGLVAAVVNRSAAKGCRATLMAVIAVALASVLFPTLSSLISSVENPDAILPMGTSNHLFWGALNGGLIGVIVGNAMIDAKGAPRTDAAK